MMFSQLSVILGLILFSTAVSKSKLSFSELLNLARQCVLKLCFLLSLCIYPVKLSRSEVSKFEIKIYYLFSQAPTPENRWHWRSLIQTSEWKTISWWPCWSVRISRAMATKKRSPRRWWKNLGSPNYSTARRISTSRSWTVHGCRRLLKNCRLCYRVKIHLVH